MRARRRLPRRAGAGPAGVGRGHRRCASCSPPTSAWPLASTSTRSSTTRTTSATPRRSSGAWTRELARIDEHRRPRPSAAALLASRQVTTPRRPAPHRQRQGPRDVRPGGLESPIAAAADGRQRPDLDLRRRPPDADPRQGQGAHGPVGVLVRADRQIVPNHLISATDGVPEEARGRALVVRRLRMLPVECVVRGYITGSGWKDYQATGAVSGIALPAGLRESEQLPEPIFTPSTKADVGHDETIDFDRAAELVGDRALMERVRDVSIELYSFAAEHARERGVILADTKFEFGLDDDGELVARRRGADARLLALLAGRRLRGRPRPAELRQAVRARLGVGERLGQEAAGAGDPRRRRRRHARALRRGLRADHRRAVRRLAARATGARSEGARADPPEGRASSTRRAWPSSARCRRSASTASPTSTSGGWSSSTSRTPRSSQPMCEKLLANPLVEDYEIAAARRGSAADAR